MSVLSALRSQIMILRQALYARTIARLCLRRLRFIRVPATLSNDGRYTPEGVASSSSSSSSVQHVVGHTVVQKCLVKKSGVLHRRSHSLPSSTSAQKRQPATPALSQTSGVFQIGAPTTTDASSASDHIVAYNDGDAALSSIFVGAATDANEATGGLKGSSDTVLDQRPTKQHRPVQGFGSSRSAMPMVPTACARYDSQAPRQRQR